MKKKNIKTTVTIEMKEYWKALNYLSLETTENIKEGNLVTFNFAFDDKTTGVHLQEKILLINVLFYCKI